MESLRGVSGEGVEGSGVASWRSLSTWEDWCRRDGSVAGQLLGAAERGVDGRICANSSSR